ncbi:MAG: NADH:ubiquinone reductase (Na(+)-transporting) subunit B [Planctomycetaceae bacterium]|nr:NADH:ubiquinone reductase (Na(+)-transporting) subunit B [Planctomycetaceae bacterium]
MKFLRKIFDDLHPQFAHGGKLERFYSLYEAIDTFLFTPADVTRGPTHVRDHMDLKRVMITVVVALTPCILMAMYNTGYQANLAIESLIKSDALSAGGIPGWRAATLETLGLGFGVSNPISCLIHGALYFLPVFLVTQIAGGFWEVLFASVRKHEINEGFLVTGMLYPLTLPPTIPLWQVALGISFGVVIGKEIFGGTGKNFLNPALTARAFLYFAYPGQMSGDKVWVAAPVDGFSAATPLGAIARPENTTGMASITEGLQMSWSDAFIGFIPGSMGETSALACLLGALLLIATGIGSWRIMLSVVVGAMGSSGLLYALREHSTNQVFAMPPHWHLVVGGLAFGLVFMATDPVSAAMTRKGQWIYGLVIGLLTTLVRVINPGYPEGIMLAILLGNVFAPSIDYFVLQANIKRRLARSAA